jgi:AraC-like DNA-binding protein
MANIFFGYFNILMSYIRLIMIKYCYIALLEIKKVRRGLIMGFIINLHLDGQLLMFSHRNADHNRFFYHAHQGIEFLFIHQGHGQVVIDQQLYTVDEPTLFIFQPLQLHKVHMQESSEINYIRSVLVINTPIFEPYLQPFHFMQAAFLYFCQSRLDQQLFRLNDHPTLIHLLDDHDQRLNQIPKAQHQEESVMFCFQLLQYVRTRLLPNEQQLPPARQKEPNRSENIMKWVDLHYSEAFSLERLSEELQLSPYHLSHAFHVDTGSTITDYLTARRLKEASLLLTTTTCSIQEIAGRVGLKNDSYFIQLFKKHFTMTPLQYRKQRQPN